MRLLKLYANKLDKQEMGKFLKIESSKTESRRNRKSGGGHPILVMKRN